MIGVHSPPFEETRSTQAELGPGDTRSALCASQDGQSGVGSSDVDRRVRPPARRRPYSWTGLAHRPTPAGHGTSQCFSSHSTTEANICRCSFLFGSRWCCANEIYLSLKWRWGLAPAPDEGLLPGRASLIAPRPQGTVRTPVQQSAFLDSHPPMSVFVPASVPAFVMTFDAR